MRIDKAKKVSSVTKELLENPLQTVREVAEKTGVSKSSVASYIQEMVDNWEFEKIINNYEQQQTILCVDIKKEIDNELLAQFILITWSKIEATKQIEDFLRISVQWSNKKRNRISDNTRYWLLYNAWFKCQACWSKPKSDNNVELEIDHIIPFTRWWICIEWNYQVLCKSCNSSKNNEFIYNHNTNE